MTLQQTPYTIPLLLSGGLSGLVASYVFVRSRRVRSIPGTIPFTVGAFAGAIWSIAYAMQVASPTFMGKVFWSRIVWIGAATVSTAWLVFVLSYTRRSSWLRPSVLALLALEPAATLLAVWTNDAHRLFVTDVWLVEVGSATLLAAETGPLFAIHLAYSYLINLLAGVLLVRFVLNSEDVYARQGIALLSGFGTIWVANVLTITGYSPLPFLDLTPLALSVASAAVAWALIRYDLFDAVPHALGTVMDTVPDAIVAFDADDRVIYCNDVARSLLGEDGVVGAEAERAFASLPTVLDYFHDDVDEQVVTVELDDERRFFDLRTTSIEHSAGGRVLVLRDVSKSRNSEIRHRTLVERSTDVTAVLDKGGTPRYVTPSIERILGYPPTEFVGTDLDELIHPEDLGPVQETFESVLSGEIARVDYRIQHADGTWRVFESTCSNVLDEPAVDGIVVNSRNVTNRRRYEQRLRVLNRVLRHDLRNGVNVIEGYSDLLAENPTDPRRTDWVNLIWEKCDNLITLSEKARQIDYTLHRENRALEPLDVIERLHSYVDASRREYPDASFELAGPESAWVHADPLIDSAFDNLIENAVEHSDQSNPSVEISVSTTTVDGISYVDVAIADDGPGISESEQQVLDEGLETQLSHASGLGLWLVNWIVEESNGELLFADNEPRGGVVTVRLRKVAESEIPDTDEPLADAP